MSDIESQRVLGAGLPRTGRLIDVGKLEQMKFVLAVVNRVRFSLSSYFNG